MLRRGLGIRSLVISFELFEEVFGGLAALGGLGVFYDPSRRRLSLLETYVFYYGVIYLL